MEKRKIVLSIIIVSIIINILSFWLYFFSLNKNLIPSRIVWGWDDITKIINRKIVEQNIEEYRKLSDLENDIIKAIEKSWDSVVSIIVTKDLKVYYEDPYDFFWWYIAEKQEEIGWWSWIIISSDWYILTNKHVVQDATADYTVITKSWDTYNVDKIWLDPVLDLAILKVKDENWDIPTNLKSASLNSVKSTVKLWQFSIAIWNALAEFQNTVTFGIISGKDRKLDTDSSTDSIYLWLYQTDAPINPGNSWWPLLDINGNVIWVNTAISSVWQWIWFAIPVNEEFIKTSLDIINKNWKLIRPYIWIKYIDLNKSVAKTLNLDKFEWVYIEEIVDLAMKKDSWLKAWDIILEINWNSITKDNNFLYQLYTYKPWDIITLMVYSDKDYKEVKITLKQRP